MLRCVVCHNDEPVKSYELTEAVITIGRLPENTISIANMGISRRHARIERDINRNYILTDLNSLNGTIVNDQKVKRATLNQGDRITIGKYTVIIDEILSDHPGDSTGVENGKSTASASEQQPEPVPQNQPDDAQSPKTDENKGGPVLIDTAQHTVYPIVKRVMSIGNSESDDIFISGFRIGDMHAIIEMRDDGIWITGSKKTSRFKVNGKTTHSHRLKHKDRLDIGNSAFAFMENG
jgi:pSer/pThr/pTyr-binding forkhead associated (FHA) protein